ncbi:MAG: Smr/MutS family protein [Burkholderiaceae bacterium]|jgi:DNA-nicking Smr family endonuclease
MRARVQGLASLKSLREALPTKTAVAVAPQSDGPTDRGQVDLDQSAFLEAMQGVAPLPQSDRKALAKPPPDPVAAQRALDERAALLESLSDEFDVETLLETDDRLSWRREGIAGEVVRKLRRGHWVTASELDLHGLRREEARTAVSAFIRDSHKRGQRCVRVIHGKGLGSRGGQPVLKSKVYGWLMQKNEVLAFCQARAQDGGSGALIVLLRPLSPP